MIPMKYSAYLTASPPASVRVAEVAPLKATPFVPWRV